jgi:hypothetical protein
MLTEKYNNSMFQLLSSVYPDVNWLPWKFERGPKNMWNDLSVQRQFLDSVAKQLNIKEMSDWYKISVQVKAISYLFPRIVKEMAKHGCTSLLIKYNHSPYKVLTSVYNQYDWLPWKFGRCPRSYFEDVNNVRKFLDWAGKELNLKDMGGWYSVTSKVNKEQRLWLMFQNLIDLGGHQAVTKYNSLYHLLSTIYPEFKWEPFKFLNSSWETLLQGRKFNLHAQHLDIHGKRQYVTYLENALGIKSEEEWNTVAFSSLRDLKLPPQWR